MYSMFSQWIRTYRDLPLKVHQTCSVYRYETKDTRPLIRVREIPWNEAHTAHATEEEALACLAEAWVGYTYLCEQQLAFTGLKLRRAKWDQFGGAEHSEVWDTILPSGKVLQSVGAHYLGQKFAGPFDITFQDSDNEFKKVWMTCFGISTRILASALTIHGDDSGLVLPPAIARYQVVFIPLINTKRDDEAAQASVHAAVAELKAQCQARGLRTYVDETDKMFSAKHKFWEMKGAPLRVEVGARDVAAGKVVLVARDLGKSSKMTVPVDEVATRCVDELEALRARLWAKASAYHNEHITDCSSVDEIKKVMERKGGFARIPLFSRDEDCKEADEILKEATGGEIRGFLADGEAAPAEGTLCAVTGRPAVCYGYVARCY
eukprot:gnl/Ergobibamus_cyprinoides/75.p2 GENE.gnl/Ergobibamus_cyprinoides/75~~gnl/Ergobibamus_cyprinoides/75.p2  ORF type:complete len:378 (-),score=180.93 gnl/Ergobibamus_cyprinoides/75:50-1183(-)